MVSSEDYWKDREADWQIEYAKNQAHWDAKINEIYTDLQNRMADEINAWYMRYADQNGLTMAQAKQAVSRADQDYYAKRAEYLVGLALQDMRSGTDQNARIYFSDVANAEMALYNTTMKISRMQVLQSMLNIQIAQSVGQTNQAMTSALTHHATQVLLDRAKVLGPTVMNNMSRLPALINASFHGATFSDRLWTTHQSNLQKGIQNALARGLILGEHPERFRREIVSESKLKTRAAFRAARTLLNTEFCRVQTSAEMMAYQSEGFKEYMYIANERCCPDCLDLDGNIYKVKDESAGQNLPPMHPNCRCSTAPYSDREEYEKWLDGYKDHGLTWEEWEEQKEQYGEARFGKANDSGVSGSVGPWGSNKVDKKYIQSSEYRRKFSRITENLKVNDVIRKFFTGTLTKFSGTDTEAMQIIDAETGEIIIRKVGHRNALGISLTPEESEMIRNYKGRKIGMHNHPTNLPPTGSDYVASGFRRYKLGVVGTHDGRVFAYQHGDEPIMQSIIDKKLEDACMFCKNEDEERNAYAKEFDRVSKERGLQCREL